MKINNNGFTLIELIVVLAITAILGAILVPNFSGIIDTTRLRSDIISVNIAQNALDLYQAEGGNIDTNNAEAMVDILVEQRYLNSNRIQTKDVSWDFKGDNLALNISMADERIRTIAEGLSEDEQRNLIGI